MTPFWIVGSRIVLKSYHFESRFNRRRNCLTETTRTRFRLAILIKSRSRLRSSSRVTRYCDLPTMAASRISSSSGSRQILSSPETCTTACAGGNQSNKRFCVSMGIPKSADQSWPNEDVSDFTELRKGCEDTELVTRPGGNDFTWGPVGFEKSGDPDVRVKQSDERHGALPLPRLWLW